MPDFNEIAQVRVPTGDRAARMPLSSTGAENAANFQVHPAVGQPPVSMARLADLWTTWATVSGSQAATISLPYQFRDDGQPIDATAALGALANVTDPTLKLTVYGVLAEGKDFVVSFSARFSSSRELRAIPNSLTYVLPDDAAARKYSDNHGTDAGATLLNGHAMGLEYQASDGFRTVLPNAKTFTPRSIWVRRQEIIGDFAALALTADAGLQSVARKTVTLEASYDPILEDLDTQIVYGEDDDGVPVVWALQGTARSATTIQLNLAADLI